jgi:tetratricopeptide (TPR) repeat protein/tRNA A-37 threonylcarbamoyl transferase component Bud32
VALLNEYQRAEGGATHPAPAAGAGAAACGDYELVAVVHRGGQGVVHKAVQRSTRRTVALKMLLHGSLATDRQRMRFDREIDLASRLSHPNIAAVYAAGVTGDGQHFLVMPFVEGAPLDEFAAASARGTIAGRRAARDAVLAVFREVCRAVAYAHQRGVIHRDLKPGNVLVDAEGRPHVLDFGLAKAVGAAAERGVSVSGEFMGTLAYASPEHVRGDPDAIDVRSDVYSLGVILYQLLTGGLPYGREGSTAAVIREIEGLTPPPPSRAGAAGAGVRFPLDGELDTIVLKALAKDPGRRYQSADELARDVERYLRGEPIDAKRDSAMYVARKFLRRHRVPVGASVLLAALVAGSAIAASVQNSVIRAQRDTIKDERDAVEKQHLIAARTSTVLRRILTGADPHEAQGHEATLTDAVNNASTWLGSEVAGAPEVEASVRATLGRVYLNQGKAPEATAQLERAIALQQQIGGESVELAEMINDLAATRLMAGKLAEAEPLALRSVAMFRGLLPHDDARLADGLAVLARIYYPQGRTAEGELVSREIWEIRRVSLGEEHPRTLQSLLSIAALVNQRGDLAEAERLTRRALTGLVAAHGDRDHEVMIALNNHMICLRDLGRASEAAEEGQRLMALRTEVQGADHPDTLASQVAYAGVLIDLRRYDRAEELLREAQQKLVAKFGPDHPRAVLARISLSAIDLKTGRGDEAVAIRREVLATQRRTLGASSPKVAMAMTSLAEALSAAGEPDEAAALAERALWDQQAALGANHPLTLHAADVLAAVLADEGKFAEAECVCRGTVDLRRRSPGAGEGGAVSSLRQLGSVLSRSGRAGDAVPVLSEAYCRAKRIGEPEGALAGEVCAMLVRREAALPTGIQPQTSPGSR